MINNSEDIQKQTDQRICFSGETEYPVHVTYVDLNRSYMNRIGWNWHPEIEVFLVEEGSAIIYYDGGRTGRDYQSECHAFHSFCFSVPEL